MLKELLDSLVKEYFHNLDKGYEDYHRTWSVSRCLLCKFYGGKFYGAVQLDIEGCKSCIVCRLFGKFRRAWKDYPCMRFHHHSTQDMAGIVKSILVQGGELW